MQHKLLRRAGALATGLAATALLATPATAQTSVTGVDILATANVLGIAPLAAVGVADLNFGTVTAGAGPVTPAAPSSFGAWMITGEPAANVSIDFGTLPSSLLQTGACAPSCGSITITYGASDGIVWSAYPGTFSTVDPNAFPSQSLGAGTLHVGIRGTINPPLGTVTGTYEATILLDVAYL